MTSLSHVQAPNDPVLPPYKIYSTFYDNDIKKAQELCVVSASANCLTGVAAHLNLNTFFEGYDAYHHNTVEFEDLFDLIRKHAASKRGKGFFVWSNVNEDVQELREFIGESRVVTGFRYDGLLPEIFEQYDLKRLIKNIFSVKHWLETYLEKPMTFSQAIAYFDLWIDLDLNGGSVKSSPACEKEILNDRKEDLFLSIYLVVVAHLIVNDKLNLGYTDS